MKPKPLGLVVLGVMAGLGGVVMALALLALDRGGSDALHEIVLVRAGAAMLAVSALTAAEALVRVRPWFWHASLALAIAWCAAVTGTMFAAVGAEGLLVGAVFIGFSLVAIVPILLYIRSEWKAMRHPVRRVPAPQRPWPLPGRVP